MNLLVVLAICSVVGARCERGRPSARVLYPDSVVQPANSVVSLEYLNWMCFSDSADENISLLHFSRGTVII